MKILIIGGFLGSGKTSVLLQLAHYLVNNVTDNNSGTKVAIIENEIGDVGIDDKVLRNTGYSVENLFAGCACCTLSGQLIESTKRILKELDPQWLIIEATGIAYPAGIKKALVNAFRNNPLVLTIVDGSRWKILSAAMETLVIGQLEEASTVLINKIDLVDKSELNRIEAQLHNINDKAKIFSISAQQDVDIKVWDAIFA